MPITICRICPRQPRLRSGNRAGIACDLRHRRDARRGEGEVARRLGEGQVWAGRVLGTRDSRRGATRGAFYALATIDRRAFHRLRVARLANRAGRRRNGHPLRDVHCIPKRSGGSRGKAAHRAATGHAIELIVSKFVHIGANLVIAHGSLAHDNLHHTGAGHPALVRAHWLTAPGGVVNWFTGSPKPRHFVMAITGR
jgi:hypothetical protein